MERFGGNRFGRRDFGGGSRDMNRDRSFAPVKVGDELDVKIEAVGGKGDGIAKKNGFVLFVPGVKEGDEVKIRVTKVLKKVGFAEVAGAAKAKPAEDAEEAPAEEKEPEEDYSGEDSEDFGEDDKESSDDEDSGDFDDSEEEEKLKKFTDEEQ
jgi:predicted RNA-binding protein with TRAM domain